MRLGVEEKKEIIVIMEWYLEDEKDKEWRKYIKSIIKKLEQ